MKITKEELKQIVEEVLKEADDYINPTGMGGDSRYEKTGRMRPYYTSHGADYERFEPTYKMTSDHPDHPDYKKPPSKDVLTRANCRRHAERSVYDYRFDGYMDRKTGDPANVEAVFTRCMELERFTPGRKKVSEYLDDIFKNEPWYKDDRERRENYWDTYYKLKPSKRKYMAEGEAKLSIATLKEFVKKTISEALEDSAEGSRHYQNVKRKERILKKAIKDGLTFDQVQDKYTEFYDLDPEYYKHLKTEKPGEALEEAELGETMDSGYMPPPKDKPKKKSKLKEEPPVAENIYSKQANMPLEDEADDIIMDAEADDIMGFLDNLPPDEKLEIINMLMDDLYQANPDLADDFDRMKRSS